MKISVDFMFWVWQILHDFIFLSGFSFTETGNSQDSRWREGTIFFFHSTTSTRWRTFRHLFAALHVRWLSHIFNCNACIYQTATRWDLPPYRITIWLIDDVMFIFICLLVELILVFVTAMWHGKQVTIVLCIDFKDQLRRSKVCWYETGLMWKENSTSLQNNKLGRLGRLEILRRNLQRN